MCHEKDYAMLQYEKLKKEEIKEASELAARAYFDYIYITIFFPGLKERQRGLARFLAKDEEAGTPCHDYQKNNPDVWYLSMIEVDPQFHSQGIGTEFLSYLEDYVRQHGGKTMVLFTNNRENLSFYTKRGYEVFHEYEITHNGQTMGNWSLRKSL